MQSGELHATFSLRRASNTRPDCQMYQIMLIFQSATTKNHSNVMWPITQMLRFFFQAVAFHPAPADITNFQKQHDMQLPTTNHLYTVMQSPCRVLHCAM